MPLEAPNLDTGQFEDLLLEARLLSHATATTGRTSTTATPAWCWSSSSPGFPTK